jgi:predicted ATPase
VLDAIAQALGVRGTRDRSLLAALEARLSARPALLLLDSFERVTAAAPDTARLLHDCPLLKLLVTSREALRVQGEHVFPVPPLGLPEVGSKLPPLEQLSAYETVRLFVERAEAVKPGFALSVENAAAIARICVRLDGLPLAIELAAARVRLFTPQALLDRLGKRLDLLRGGARDLPARQQTLRDAIGWSYELLDARLLRRLHGGSGRSGGRRNRAPGRGRRRRPRRPVLAGG